MADYPFIPWYPRDWLADTRKLTAAQRGAYVDLLCFCWLTPDCRLEDNDAELARMAGVRQSDWSRYIRPGIEKLWCIKDGFWSQKRLSEEHDRVRSKRDANRTSGSLGGRAKALNMRQSGLANASQTLERKATIPEADSDSESYPNSESESPPKVADTSIVASGKRRQPRRHVYTAEFEHFWQAYPKRPTDTKASACKAWDKAIANGVDEPVLQTAAERYAAYATRSCCETMLVQTWINREGWTASYAGGAHGNGNHASRKREDWYGRRLMEECFGTPEAQPDPGPDSPEPERRPTRWRG